jgi:hypothetical protein
MLNISILNCKVNPDLHVACTHMSNISGKKKMFFGIAVVKKKIIPFQCCKSFKLQK